MHDAAMSETTRLIHGNAAALSERTPAPPIQRGSTVLLDGVKAMSDPAIVNYGRSGLITHKTLRHALRDLEHADDVFLYPSGLAAITGTLFAVLSAGDEILLCDSVYNPTRRFLAGTLARFGVTARYYAPSATAAEIVAMAIPATRAIMLESPGSLTFEMQDVPDIARLARSAGILTLIDNTWAAGMLFKPLDHGVDVSVQALTKYVCGHSDVFMGSAAVRGDLVETLARSSYEIGWSVSPDDAYAAVRGLRTLHTRLAHHGKSALAVAQWLEQQSEILSVMCPGLPTDPGHAIWKRDFTGLSGLIGIVLRPEVANRVPDMIETLSLFGLGYSWGGFESLAIPADPQLESRTCGHRYAGPVVRLHIGLEDVSDLIDDLRRGLDALH